MYDNNDALQLSVNDSDYDMIDMRQMTMKSMT